MENTIAKKLEALLKLQKIDIDLDELIKITNLNHVGCSKKEKQ